MDGEFFSMYQTADWDASFLFFVGSSFQTEESLSPGLSQSKANSACTCPVSYVQGFYRVIVRSWPISATDACRLNRRRLSLYGILCQEP